MRIRGFEEGRVPRFSFAHQTTLISKDRKNYLPFQQSIVGQKPLGKLSDLNREEKCCTPGGSRTPNPQIRSLMLPARMTACGRAGPPA